MEGGKKGGNKNIPPGFRMEGGKKSGNKNIPPGFSMEGGKMGEIIIYPLVSGWKAV